MTILDDPHRVDSGFLQKVGLEDSCSLETRSLPLIIWAMQEILNLVLLFIVHNNEQHGPIMYKLCRVKKSALHYQMAWIAANLTLDIGPHAFSHRLQPLNRMFFR